MNWCYEKLNDDGKTITVGTWTIDSKREYTGQYVVNVKAWFDEHDGYWQEHGWTKHIVWEDKEIKKKWPHNAQTQILIKEVKRVDAHTVEDDYHIVDKSEEMMRLQEMLDVVAWGDGNVISFGVDI